MSFQFPPETAAPKISVLVVEDEALIAENLRYALEDLGYAVAATCYSYAEAQAAFTTHPTDLVLLDLNLGSRDPADDGIALAAELRILGRPFIFLTAYDDLHTIRRATRTQPSGYLIKPVNNATLFAAIQTAIERFNTLQVAPLPPAPLPTPDYFFVKVGTGTHKLQWTDVACLEAGKNYVTLRTAQQRLGYPLRGSLTTILDTLVPATLRGQFIRINRRICLNTQFITGFDDEWVYCGSERFENGRTAHEQLQALTKVKKDPSVARK
jgi:two-component system, LytTR family, response regulator LytT